MAVLLKVEGDSSFIKKVIWAEGKVEFTDRVNDAKHYTNDWFADAERKQLKFYCDLPCDEGGLAEDYSSKIKKLVVHYT